jgi:heat shock protein HtpX
MEQNSRIDFRDQISKNKKKSVFLMIGIFCVLVLLGYVISMAFAPGYVWAIMIFATIFSIIYVVASFYNSHKIAIASVGAKKAVREVHKIYFDSVEGLTIASGLPMPELYIMKSEQINAFASGRDPEHAVICVTEGALKKLERRELEGVLAHELGHIANYDIRYITIVAVMVGMIAIISQIFLRSLWFRGRGNDKSKGIFILIGIVLAILAPIVVYFVQMSISRKREFSSDASAVMFTRYPNGLIGALKKIKTDNVPAEKKINKAVAPLFISNPFRNAGRTHPPLDERIKVLERM